VWVIGAGAASAAVFFRAMKMNPLRIVSIVPVVVCLLIGGLVQAGTAPPLPSVADAQSIGGDGQGQWQKATRSSADAALPYQFFVPSQSDLQPLPLMIFLHGSGEAGTDNQLQMYAKRNVGPTFFASEAVQRNHKAYVLAPQTPKAIRWASVDLHEYDFATTPITVSMQLLLTLIDELVAEHNIDPARVYIGGLSRGGHGTWNALLHRPELFAAAIPMAGGGSPAYADRIDHLAIWAFHGTADNITPLRYTQRMYGAVKALAGDTDRLRLTEYEGGNHASAWMRGHREPGFADWLFQWRNPNVAARRTTGATTQATMED
jgi:predicted peptidase